MKARKKIYLVDDNQFTLLLLGRKLKKTLGCKVRLFTSAKECMMALQKDDSPHVIVSDYNLQEEKSNSMNGDKLLLKLKKFFPEIPVVMYTSKTDRVFELRMLQHGADAVVSGGDHLFDEITEGLREQFIRLQRLSRRRKFVWATLLCLAVLSGGMLTLVQHYPSKGLYLGTGVLFAAFVLHFYYTVRNSIPY